MARLDISEAQIEGAFVGNLDLLAKRLKTAHPLKLIARQFPMKGGDQRLDMLLTCGKRLALVELKVGVFSDKHLRQTLQYRESLREMQAAEELPMGAIDAYLLVTAVGVPQVHSAAKQGVRVVEYDPLEVMSEYFHRMASLSPFLQIKPKDYGAYSLTRIANIARAMVKGNTSMSAIAAATSLKKSTVYHILSGAADFGIARKKGEHWFLTDFGDAFVSEQESEGILSHKQTEMVREFVSKHPFHSPTAFGVSAVVECAFLLARNSYPVDVGDLNNNFRMVGGKTNEWRDNVLDRRTRAFVRFAVELDLLGRIGEKVVITPAGFRFVLMMQLHKGIEMIEGLSFQEDA